MPATYERDLIGYGTNPPNPKWPGGARIAVNFVMNYEEGSEPSVQDGEGPGTQSSSIN
jgi:allantoinase